MGTNNIHVPLLLDPAGRPIPVNELPLPESLYRFLREQGLGTGPEVAREYNFRIGLQNELPNYTNAAPQNLASAFSQPPQDFRRLAALTEQHLKKPESRDAFYGGAIRGIPENLRPQFLAVVRETQERRKAHLRTPGAPLIREHTNRPSGSADSRGSNPVPNQTVGKPIPAVKTPILAAASPNPATSEAAPGTPPRSLPYLPLAGVLAAGLVLWWFLSRSRPG